jgi:energy-coupling factor transporter transmembrane protein EcfT
MGGNDLAGFLVFHYSQEKSFIHSLDARIKLILVIAVNIFIYLSSLGTFLAYTGLLLGIALAVRIPLLNFFSQLRFFLILFLIVIILNFFTSSQFPKIPLGLFETTIFVSPEAATSLIFQFSKLLLMLLVNSVLLWSTPVIAIRDAVFFFLRPFSIQFAHIISTMIRTTFIAIPTLLDYSREIDMKLRARGCNPKRRFFAKIWATGKLMLEKMISFSFEYSWAIRARGFDFSISRIEQVKRNNLQLKKLWKTQYGSYFVEPKNALIQLVIAILFLAAFLALFFFLPRLNLGLI